MKTYEILLLAAALGMLVSLPWIAGFGLFVWLLAKLVYFIGLAFFLKACFLE